MSWRRVPPVLSPVAPASLVSGIAAAAGFADARRSAIRAFVMQTFGARDVVLTDSGTSALVLALRMALGNTRAVALPGYACIDLVAAARRANATVRLYDIDPRTLSPDIDSVRRALSRGADAIVVAPLFGYPVDMPAINAVAREHAAVVIEDAAQGAGGVLGGVRIGAMGAVSVLSFGRGKGTTGGSGGAVLVHDARFLEAASADSKTLDTARRGWRDVVALGAQWVLGRPSLYVIPTSIPVLRLGEMVYHEAHEPRGLAAAASRMLQAAFAADPHEVRTRRARAALLTDASRRDRLAMVSPIANALPGYLRLAALDVTGNAMPEPRFGVLRSYPITLDQHAVTQPMLAPGERAGSGARELRDRLFTLPTHSGYRDADLRKLADWLGASSHRAPARLSTDEAV